MRGRGIDLLYHARDLLELVGGDRLVVAPLAHGGRYLGRAVDPEIGADQHLLNLVEHRAVELALDDEIGDGAADRGGGALEPAAQALPPSRLLVAAVGA